MIDIVYDPSRYRLTMRGHADSAPAGQDLVCASASALYNTLWIDLEHMADDEMLTFVVCRACTGDAELEVRPAGDLEAAEIGVVIRTICGGLRELAKNYPQYAQYREV